MEQYQKERKANCAYPKGNGRQKRIEKLFGGVKMKKKKKNKEQEDKIDLFNTIIFLSQNSRRFSKKQNVELSRQITERN